MSALTEIKQMQDEGVPEDKIISALREKGVSYKDISEALAQTKIKAAVENDENAAMTAQMEGNMKQNQDYDPSQQYQGPAGMQQSIMTPEAPTQEYVPPTQDYPPQYGYDQYQGYPQQQGFSPDTITEISEQIVAEKMQEVRSQLKKAIDFRTTAEAKIDAMDERLKAIEKTINALQLSILKKVGEYVTNVQDIKDELVETQKTFSKLVPSKKHHEHHKKEHTHHSEKHKK